MTCLKKQLRIDNFLVIKLHYNIIIQIIKIIFIYVCVCVCVPKLDCL